MASKGERQADQAPKTASSRKTRRTRPLRRMESSISLVSISGMRQTPFGVQPEEAAAGHALAFQQALHAGVGLAADLDGHGARAEVLALHHVDLGHAVTLQQ